jgi:hypothetical protein
MSDLYDSDILTWSEHQADLLRRVAAGDAPSWRADAIDFRRQARDAFTPSMRQKIDVAALYADALAALPETIIGQAPLSVPDVCPRTLEELLSDTNPPGD